jgi:hypothetical protein
MSVDKKGKNVTLCNGGYWVTEKSICRGINLHGKLEEFETHLKGDTAAIILDGVKIVQKSKQRSIENKTEQQFKSVLF